MPYFVQGIAASCSAAAGIAYNQQYIKTIVRQTIFRLPYYGFYVIE
ncbi:hypothetical protein [uncultured Sporomusa sp.]|nr:hypothetical protein [uncultured Sporomusa sp.]